MQETQQQRRPGPPPSVYVVLRVIGCRPHWLAVTGGWAPVITTWTQSWMTNEREIAYQAARCSGGLLVRLSQDEWADYLNRAASQGTANEEPNQEVQS